MCTSTPETCVLAALVRSLTAIRPGRAWAGHYDLNLFDHNAIVGTLPGVQNMIVAAGFSGHGLQQSPAIGRGLAELIVDGEFKTLERFSFERIAKNAPLIEKNVI